MPRLPITLSSIKKKKAKGKAKIASKKISVDGITFDSEAEAIYYKELRVSYRQGVIQDVFYQPKVELLPGLQWKLDFMYTQNKKTFFVDVKGMMISDRAKTKLQVWNAISPAPLLIVKRDPISGEFIQRETHIGVKPLPSFFKVVNPGEKMYT